MKTINLIKEWWQQVVAEVKQKRAEHRTRALMLESCDVLQAMEFNGELFICYRGMPIVREDQLKSSIPEALVGSRETYVEWVKSNVL